MKNSNTQQITVAQREGRRSKITILSNGFVRAGFQMRKPSLYLILLSLCRRDLLWTKIVIVIEYEFGFKFKNELILLFNLFLLLFIGLIAFFYTIYKFY